jgi:hypothetical protein
VSIKVIVELDSSAASPDWAEAAWSSIRGYPSRCWYFQGRLFLARTTTQPHGFWGSKPFIYDNFDPGTGLADDAISELIPGSSEIMTITGNRALLIGTDIGDFVATSGDSTGVLLPENIGIRQQTGWGSEPIQTKIVGSFAYNVQEGRRKFRELSYYFQQDSYKSIDMTMLAENITDSGIVDVSYQRNPYSTMPNVLTNGKMAMLTRDADQEVLGWSPWDTDGTYESVGVIPHPTEDHDMIFNIVKRTINGSTKRYVEYFESPTIPDRQELCFYVDCGIRYNAYEANTGGSLTLSALTGDGITVTAGSSVFVAGNVDKRIRAIDSAGVILGELKITAYASGTSVTADVVKDFDSLTYVANDWGISVTSVSGLTHLEAKTVKLLIDGGTSEDLVVTSGAVTIDDVDDGFIIAVGLGYTGRWKNLPIEAGSATGTAQGKRKRIYQCGYKFYRSLGMSSGGDEDHLRPIKFRAPATLLGQAEPLFTGISPPQKIDSTNNYEGHIVIQQDNPLPMCILAVMPLLNTNDK